MSTITEVSFSHIEAAAKRLAGVVHRTPVVTSKSLDEVCGCKVFLKCENLQRMGAFKMRGAYNAISRLDVEQKRRGIITFSSGNHAQATALSGRLLGVSTVIVMPQDAPSVKRAATEGYGAQVMLYDRSKVKREAFTADIQKKRNLTLIPPYDHPHIVAGQGTVVKELLEQVGELDALLVPCGGGGLLSGSALSARALSPDCRVIGVEPEAGYDGKRSFESGSLQTVETPDTIADGARTPSLGKLTFSLIRQHVDAMESVTDAELIRTMHFLWERLKLVVEPTGALGLTPLFHRRLALEGKRVGVVLSGGNVDLKSALALFSGLA